MIEIIAHVLCFTFVQPVSIFHRRNLWEYDGYAYAHLGLLTYNNFSKFSQLNSFFRISQCYSH